MRASGLLSVTPSTPMSPAAHLNDEQKKSLIKRVQSVDGFRITAPLEKNQTLPFVGIADATSSFFTTDKEQVWTDDLRVEIEDHIISRLRASGQDSFNIFSDLLPVVVEGVDAVVKDSFTESFRPRAPDAWNWNIFLFFTWTLGVIVRYLVLFPMRFLFLLLGTLIFILVNLILLLVPPSKGKDAFFRKLLNVWSSVWLYSLSAVIKYHNAPPPRRPNQIFVSNHTSLIDFIVLTEHCGVATVGQKHPGLVGFLQNKVIAPLRNIWFERFESRDRSLVAKRIKDHINDTTNPPLLIFPEGVCVNNEYCVMFKKGVFEIDDVEICPIAIKYNKTFSDPYWSSKDESFVGHIMRLMKSWCLVADVWFLEPEKKGKKESPIDFASRIQKMISAKAGLVNLSWDGYLKYYAPSDRLRNERQKIVANQLKRRFGHLFVEEEEEQKEKKEEPQSDKKNE
ncbi:glycerol-3-phosphate O-acyltransferase 3/4 [Acrasis kona]|uniref:Glycerol-3-phosphate O-acyltransferase 3/4 n=1 Tax=Acrasis kona TaxID=1008807 RepID=A0AAW2YX38_9EUKA